MSSSKKNALWYEKYAHDYFEHINKAEYSIYHSFYEKPAMYSILPDLKGKKVITLGCGSGEETQYLKNLGAKEGIGIDISKNLIKIASKNYPDCSFKVINIEKMKFSKESFDFVYSSLVMHYLENWSSVFKNIFKILKPKSFFIFSCGHPISTSMEIVKDNKNTEIKSIEICKNKKSKRIFTKGDYFTKRAFKDKVILNSDGCVVVWHRTLSEMMKMINDSGFLIKEILEPEPLPELKKISPEHYKRLKKIPKFIIFKLFKP